MGGKSRKTGGVSKALIDRLLSRSHQQFSSVKKPEKEKHEKQKNIGLGLELER